MSVSKHERMTSDEFMVWAMRQPEGVRYELDGGEVVAMAPERASHGLTKLRVARRLAEAVERAGLRCDVFGDGMAVRIDERTTYEPDAVVRCGPTLADDATELTDPVVVAEVRSPSTGGVDTGAKFAGYLRLPSVRHYLVVIAQTCTIIHHARAGDGRIETAIVRDGPVTLDPPGLVLDGVWPSLPASTSA